MQFDKPQIRPVKKESGMLTITSNGATPEEVLNVTQRALPAFTVTVKGAAKDETVQPKSGPYKLK